MRTPRIAAVATATPTQRFTQAELLAIFGYTDAQRRSFFEHSGIEGRFMYIDQDQAKANENIDALNARFRAGALELAELAARRALERAGWASADIDFVATTTCTGRLTPSLDARLIQRLGCRSTVQRVHVGDTGCASAVVALQQAWNHVRAFPAHRAIVTAVEICSAAYFHDDRLESAVAHAIFADGAGVVLLSADGSGPAIVGHRTLFRSEHLDAMGFEYPGGRPRIVLSKEIRRLGPMMMRQIADELLQCHGLKRADVDHWILHSAGRRVLDGAQGLLQLEARHLSHSRTILRRYGNMASATIFFVLEEALNSETTMPGAWGLMIGLGPGFAAEGALLRW